VFVVNPTITVRLGEEELRRLDELAQRMGRTRSDVVRDLINRFDELLKQEVERERKKWVAIGFVGALESAILEPTLVLRFVRRNVDVLGYPDFIIGMVRVKNRVVFFSHQDKVGHQLLQLVRAKIEEEVRKEEMEIERERGEDEDSEGGRATPVRIRVSRPVRPNTMHAIPVAAGYKPMSNNMAVAHTARPAATAAAGRPGSSGGSGGAKATVATTVPENQKLAGTGLPISTNPAISQPRDSGPQASTGSGGANSVRPGGGGSMGKPAGDFAVSLITNLYHKYRNALLKAVEEVMGG